MSITETSSPQAASHDVGVVVGTAPELHVDPRFIQHMLGWYRSLGTLSLADATPEPEHAAIFSTDLIVGFAYEGRLASPRVAALIPRTRELFKRAYERGVRHFIMTQDTHSPDTPEFAAWGAHAVRGTHESQMVPELADLPFSDEFTVVEKNSLSQFIGTGLEGWVAEHPEVKTFMAVGDCTDLCVYQMAMFLRLQANALNIQGRRVIIAADLVDTYDLPIDTALRVKAMPHPGDFFHLVFLYHMALNGIEVVRSIV
jgi:nicotinamidase-related amidase